MSHIGHVELNYRSCKITLASGCHYLMIDSMNSATLDKQQDWLLTTMYTHAWMGVSTLWTEENHVSLSALQMSAWTWTEAHNWAFTPQQCKGNTYATKSTLQPAEHIRQNHNWLQTDKRTRHASLCFQYAHVRHACHISLLCSPAIWLRCTVAPCSCCLVSTNCERRAALWCIWASSSVKVSW